MSNVFFGQFIWNRYCLMWIRTFTFYYIFLFVILFGTLLFPIIKLVYLLIPHSLYFMSSIMPILSHGFRWLLMNVLHLARHTCFLRVSCTPFTLHIMDNVEHIKCLRAHGSSAIVVGRTLAGWGIPVTCQLASVLNRAFACEIIALSHQMTTNHNHL